METSDRTTTPKPELDILHALQIMKLSRLPERGILCRTHFLTSICLQEALLRKGYASHTHGHLAGDRKKAGTAISAVGVSEVA
jgi:hypothetical protein